MVCCKKNFFFRNAISKQRKKNSVFQIYIRYVASVDTKITKIDLIHLNGYLNVLNQSVGGFILIE